MLTRRSDASMNLPRDEPVSAEEADQNNDGEENHEARGGRRTNQLARRVRFLRLPERLLKPRDGSRGDAIERFAGELVHIQRRQRQDAAGPDLNQPHTAERLRSDDPGAAPSMRSSSIRRAPAARSAGSRPTTRARSVTIGRLKNTSVAGCLDLSTSTADAAGPGCGDAGAAGG